MRCSFFISALRWIMDRERGVLCSCIPMSLILVTLATIWAPEVDVKVCLFVSVCHRDFIAPRIAEREQGQSEHFLPKGLRHTHTQIHTGKHNLQSIMMRIKRARRQRFSLSLSSQVFPSFFSHALHKVELWISAFSPIHTVPYLVPYSQRGLVSLN